MPDTPTLHSLVRESLERFPANDDDTVAIDVLNTLKVARSAALVLVGVVADVVASERRAVVRDLERRAFPRGAPSSAQIIPDAKPIDMIAARAQLLREGFWLQNGRHISFAEATVADHEARIGWFRTHIAGCQRTVSVHERAIETIRTAGVTCLAEVEQVA